MHRIVWQTIYQVKLGLANIVANYQNGGRELDTFFSVEEAARRLGGLSKHTINTWLSQGKLQRTKIGSRTMIRESELLKVIEHGGKSPAPRRAETRTTGSEAR
jgi:excisionase family DNA binding protein